MIKKKVNFTEAVTVTGTPQLQLETGTTDETVNYTSGSGTSTLEFDYTIQAGDTSADLVTHATAALPPNVASISDAAASAAVRTLVVGSGSAGSLANAKNIIVDTTAP